ncbi:MAG: methyltransferase domain-containing protein, partial [Planctomycetales bacterium]|nr:methyltransferase domain-containing protein [Planctomycetales bacterium]
MQSEFSQHQRVLNQYSESSGASFYRWVMGDGGCDIHYGIYDGVSTMQDATRASTKRLLEIALRSLADGPVEKVIDLGAGRGGSAHLIAQSTGAEVTCVDLCDHHLRDNQAKAFELGIGEKIRTLTGEFERLPTEFTSQFDLAWSQESICHAEHKQPVINEAYRVLRPGGVFAFSDILLAENATPEQSAAFTDVNAVTQLGTSTEYINSLESAGFKEITYEDWTPYLADNFATMLEMIRRHRDRLIESNVPAEHIDKFAAALRQRLTWKPGEIMCWGAF